MMVSCYGYETWRHKQQVDQPFLFFELLSTIKVNLVAKIMQSAYLCLIFHHVMHKKIPFLVVLS